MNSLSSPTTHPQSAVTLIDKQTSLARFELWLSQILRITWKFTERHFSAVVHYFANCRFRATENWALRASNVTRYAEINWNVDTAILISEVEATYPHPAGHRRRVLHRRTLGNNDYRLQIDIISDYLLRPDSLQRNLFAQFSADEAASLVYELGKNGMIAVMAWPHRSEHVSLLDNNPFILEYIPAFVLSGASGRRRIRKHLKLLTQLSAITMTQVAPSAKSANFIDKLRRDSNRFQSIYKDRSEYRKAYLTQEMNFSIGLVGGLVASSLIPLLPAVGKILKARADEVSKLCADIVDSAKCKNEMAYDNLNSLATALSEPVIVILVGVLTICGVWYIKRLLQNLRS